MWRVRNESTGKEQVWYEGELIEEIKDRIEQHLDAKRICYAQEILDLIASYEGERCQ